jgi:uncharacterized membrane protein
VQKLERWLIGGAVTLILLLVALVIIGPRIKQRPATPERELGPGETETMTARVAEVLEEGIVESGFGSGQPYQRLLLHVESGSMAGKEVIVEEGTLNVVGQERLFRAGDRVYLERAIGPQQERLYITDFVRSGSLLGIAALFVGLVLLVGRGKGLRALLGTLFSLAVILAVILPQIKAGRDPVSVSVAGSVVLLSISTYLVYGWNPKAHAALAGMALSLALTAVLAWLFVDWSHLSGFGTEESAYLLAELGPGVSLRGVVLSGIIIGSLGVLDDVCIGQASAIFELVNANRDLDWKELFRRSLNIGRDHIAAMVNTLFLAYVGAAMPLVMVFSIYQEPLWRRINREPISEEIVRTLAGSIGLVLAVPITSLIASLLARWMIQRERARTQGVEAA